MVKSFTFIVIIVINFFFYEWYFDVFPKNIKEFIRNSEIRLKYRFDFENNNKEKVKEEDENLAHKIITSIFNYIWRF